MTNVEQLIVDAYSDHYGDMRKAIHTANISPTGIEFFSFR